MKTSEIRELSAEERTRKVQDLTEELFNFRFQHGVGQLENTTRLKLVKRDIARVKTVIQEFSLKQSAEKE
jgi:large subunit ribosomal protein L29